MFPVPQHLPRATEPSRSSAPGQPGQSAAADPVLDFLEPLFTPSSSEAGPSKPRRLQLNHIQGTRTKLQEAVERNKNETHELVTRHYADIASHIRTSIELREGTEAVSKGLKRLNEEISPHASDHQKSFIAPALDFLNTHVSLERSHAQAKIRASAYRALKRQIDGLRNLQASIEGGKALNREVLDELLRPDELDGGSAGRKDKFEARALEGSRMSAVARRRRAELWKQVEKSVKDSWVRMIRFEHSAKGGKVEVLAGIQLDLPTPSTAAATTTSTNHRVQPVYETRQITAALQRFGFLPPLLQSLRSSLSATLLVPLLTHSTPGANSIVLRVSSSNSSSFLHTQTVPEPPSPADIVESCRTYLAFIGTSLFPDPGPDETNIELNLARQDFLSKVAGDLLRSMMDLWLLPTSPLSPEALPGWLETLDVVSVFEDSLFSASSPFGTLPADVKVKPIIRPFFEADAATTWVARKRETVASQVRELILGGWLGWETKEVTREKEVVEVVEVEVEEEHPTAAIRELEKSGPQQSAEGYMLEESDDPGHSDTGKKQEEAEKDKDGFGWGFDDAGDPSERKSNGVPSDPAVSFESESATEERDAAADDGWGFEEPVAASPMIPAEPAVAKTNGATFPLSQAPAAPAETPLEEGEGWDFEMTAPPTTTSPGTSQSAIAAIPPVAGDGEPKPAPKKPAREAKRLGKKIAKAHEAQADEEDDPWGSVEDASERTISSGTDAAHRQSTASSVPKQVPPPASAPSTSDDWTWGDESAPASAPSAGDQDQATVPPPSKPAAPQRRKIKIALRPVTRTVTESLLVSRGTDRLLSLAEEVLADCARLGQMNLRSPSFSRDKGAVEELRKATTDVLEVWRALMPVRFEQQVRDVPALGMQLYNDCLHLADRLDALHGRRASEAEKEMEQGKGEEDVSAESKGMQELCVKLLELGEWTFERQLERQREGLLDTLSGADGFEGTGDDAVYRKSERVVQQVKHELEGLSRVLKTVLPTTTHLMVIGHLLSVILSSMTAAVLSLRDITELESERLAGLLLLLQPLENLFILPSSSSASSADHPHPPTPTSPAMPDSGNGTDTASTPPTAVASYVAPWLRFCYLAELLNASLVDITYLYESGALVDYSTVELVGLVKALFADSEKRDKAIGLIESGGAANAGGGPRVGE